MADVSFIEQTELEKNNHEETQKCRQQMNLAAGAINFRGYLLRKNPLLFRTD